MDARAPGDDADVERALAAWRAHDEARALVPADRALVASGGAARALVVEHALRAGAGQGDAEFYDACAALGWILGREGATPTLAASTVDGLAAALGAGPAAWLAPTRAALVEAYVAARLDAAAEAARSAWEFPACAVAVDDACVALAAGYPGDDGERLAEWATRVARAAVRAGVRRARVAGGDAQVAALGAALELAGVAVERAATPGDDPPREGRGRVRAWLPWRR